LAPPWAAAPTAAAAAAAALTAAAQALFSLKQQQQQQIRWHVQGTQQQTTSCVRSSTGPGGKCCSVLCNRNVDNI
jgi:hypothetical protein